MNSVCASIPDLLALRMGSTRAEGKVFYVANLKPSRRYAFIRDATAPGDKTAAGNVTFEANWKRLDDKAFEGHVEALPPTSRRKIDLARDTVLVKIFQHDMTEVTTVTTPYLKTPLSLEILKPIVLQCLLSSRPATVKHVPLLLEIGDFKRDIIADEVALSFMNQDTAAAARKHSRNGGIYIVQEHLRDYVPIDRIRYRCEQKNIASLRTLRDMLENILRALSAVATALGDPYLDHGNLDAPSSVLYDASAKCAVLTNYLDLIYVSSARNKKGIPYSLSSKKEAADKTASRLSCFRNQLIMVFNKKVSLGKTFAKHLHDNGGTLEDADSVLTVMEMDVHKSAAILQVRLIAMAIYCALVKPPLQFSPIHILSFKQFAITGLKKLPAIKSAATIFDYYIGMLREVITLEEED